MLRISNVKLSIVHTKKQLENKIANAIKISPNNILSYDIIKKSIDARNKDKVQFVYTIDVNIDNENKYLNRKNIVKVQPIGYYTKKITKTNVKRPVIVGFGPAGLFCGLILSEAGLNPIIIEQGKNIVDRTKDVDNFFATGQLNEDSNIQFGEGGAGTFSDGKLTTGIKDNRIYKVFKEFVDNGAPEEIKYDQKPHIGTDKLVDVLVSIRKRIQSLGGEIRFSTKLVDINYEKEKIVSIKVKDHENDYEIDADNVILALGHSARNTFEMLFNKKIAIIQKPFAIGMRIEHLQNDINISQYGSSHDKLPPAEYKLNHRTKNGRGVYTFCMCPGGTVVGATSEKNRIVTNGMSVHARDGVNSNAGLLIGVSGKDFKSDHPLAGIEFQRAIEEKAFILGGENYKAPVQLLGDFLDNKQSKNVGEIEPTFSNGYKLANLRELFSDELNNAFIESISMFNRKLKGFSRHDAVVSGVESRSSSPIRITRDETLQSNIKGIYPCGEGAGYAGGIISAAVDGIKCAEEVIKSINM